MKTQILKKSLFFSVLYLILISEIQAQMIDLIGSMTVDGTQMMNSVKSVGYMNKTFQNRMFIDQLQMKIVEISTTYFENYQKMKIQNVHINGIKIIFEPINGGKNYQALVPFISENLCRSLLQNHFDNLISVRVISDNSSYGYTPEQFRSNPGLCVTADSLALIFY